LAQQLIMVFSTELTELSDYYPIASLSSHRNCGAPRAVYPAGAGSPAIFRFPAAKQAVVQTPLAQSQPEVAHTLYVSAGLCPTWRFARFWAATPTISVAGRVASKLSGWRACTPIIPDERRRSELRRWRPGFWSGPADLRRMVPRTRLGASRSQSAEEGWAVGGHSRLKHRVLEGHSRGPMMT
jgi:hypothetical protein